MWRLPTPGCPNRVLPSPAPACPTASSADTTTSAVQDQQPRNEFYGVAFRKEVYRSIDELQADLDSWLKDYNESIRPMTKEKMITAYRHSQIKFELIHHIGPSRNRS